MTMIYVALTGIARHVMKELLAARVRTVEIRSPHNFVALLHIQAGDKVFMTESSAQDIVPGTTGLIASIMEIQLITHRVIQTSEDYYEEREAQAARAQLHLDGMGRVRKVATFEMGLPLELEVDLVKYCDAG
jgi:uncharacterized protein